MSDSFKNARGQVGIVTGTDGRPQWLYAWEPRGSGSYAIIWVLIDRPGKTMAYVATEREGKWATLADLARATPGSIGAAASLDRVELQGGAPSTAPLQGFTVYKDDGTGPLGFQSAEVFFDPMTFGTPTLLAQLGREHIAAGIPDNGIRIAPSSAAAALGLPLTGSSSDAFSFADGGTVPAAPTAPPGFGGGTTTPPTKISSSSAVTALALIALAGGLLVMSQR